MELPMVLDRLEKLEELKYGGLELDYPAEVINGGAKSIVNFYKKLKEGEKKVLNEIKLLFVGEGRVGKTCLKEGLVHDKFYTQYDNSTQGCEIEIVTWEVPIVGIDGQKEEFVFNAWDFGGQDHYTSTHKFFFTNRSIYILVWDATKDLDESKVFYWLDFINTLGGDDSPVIIVANKCETSTAKPNNLTEDKIKSKYPNIKLKLLETSCKATESNDEDKKRMQPIKDTIIEVAREMKDRFPISYFQIKKELEKIKDEKNLKKITKTKISAEICYNEICTSHNLKEKDCDESLKLFTDIGIVLNYKDIPMLANDIILDPNWISKAFYKILTELNKSHEYQFTETKLINMIGNDIDPKWIKELIQKDRYEFAFKVPDKDYYIIPQLLPGSDQPEYPLWDNSKNIEFKFSYEPLLLPGIIGHFIVRMHEYIIIHENKPLCWKNGIYLHKKHGKENCQALIKADPKKDKITVKLSGACKREFFLKIYDELDTIHKKYRGKLKFNLTIPCTCVDGCTHSYKYEDVIKRREHGSKYTFECANTGIDIAISKLLEGIDLPDKEKEIIERLKNINKSIEELKNDLKSKTDEIILNLFSANDDIKKTIFEELQPEITSRLDEIKKALPNGKKSKVDNLETLSNVTKALVEVAGEFPEVKLIKLVIALADIIRKRLVK
jgi:small GTP-binding protein